MDQRLDAASSRTRTVTWDDPLASAKAGAKLSGIEYLRAMANGTIPMPPLAALLGFDFDEVSEGRVVFSMMPGEHHYNPIGVVHGGVAATVLDSAMGCAVQSTQPRGRGYSTLELKVNLVRALTADSGRVHAIGTVIHVGRQTATAEGRLVDAKGKLYAHSTTTCILLDNKQD